MSTLSGDARVSLCCDDLALLSWPAAWVPAWVFPFFDRMSLEPPIRPKWDPWRAPPARLPGHPEDGPVLGGRPFGAHAPRSAASAHETAKFRVGHWISRFCTILPGVGHCGPRATSGRPTASTLTTANVVIGHVCA